MIKFQFKVQSRDNFAFEIFTYVKELTFKTWCVAFKQILFNDLNHIEEIRIQRMIINTLR